MFLDCLLLHTVLEGLAEWAKGCICRDFLRGFNADAARAFAQTLRDMGLLFDGIGFKCPLEGLRAPELAAGDWRVVLDKLWELKFQDVLKKAAHVIASSYLNSFQIWSGQKLQSGTNWVRNCSSGHAYHGAWL